MDDSTNPFEAPQTTSLTAADEQLLVELSPALRRTGTGLTLAYYAILAMIVSGLLLGAGGAMRAAPGAQTPLGLATLLAFVTASSLAVLGRWRCLSAPAEADVRKLILASLILELSYDVCLIVEMLTPKLLPPALGPVLALLSMAGTLLFIHFLRKLSRFIGRQDMCRRATTIFVSSMVLFALVMAGPMAMFLLIGRQGAGPAAGGPTKLMVGLELLMFLILIGCLVVFVMYANLIRALGRLLTGKGRPKPVDPQTLGR